MALLKNLIGQQFGTLAVLARAESIVDSPGHKTTRWLCQCACGTKVTKSQCHLVRAKSCGCQRKRIKTEIEPGQVFGRLTAVSLHDKRFSGHRVWECRCTCNAVVLVTSSELVGGQKSCGCAKSDAIREAIRKPQGHAGKTKLYHAYKNGAETRGLSFSLDFPDFLRLTQLDCFYCGVQPAQVSDRGKTPAARKHSAYIYNGLDRIQNDVGYELSNVLPCCSTCNYARGGLAQDSFLLWIAQAYRHSFGGAS